MMPSVFRAIVIARVENSHPPLPKLVAQSIRRMILEPVQSRGAQVAQPIVLFNRRGQLAFGAPQRLIQTVPVISEQSAERQFDRRTQTRPCRQRINRIEQNRTADFQTDNDSISKFLYTFRRGVFFFHITSLPLANASWGGRAASLYLSKLVLPTSRHIGGRPHDLAIAPDGTMESTTGD